MDVLVIMQPQFPKSFVENMEVPQLQFFDRVVVSCFTETGTQCKLCRRPEILQVQFLDWLGHARRLHLYGDVDIHTLIASSEQQQQ